MTSGDEPGGSLRTALANAMVGLKKQYYGKGPTGAKAWMGRKVLTYHSQIVFHPVRAFEIFILEPQSSVTRRRVRSGA